MPNKLPADFDPNWYAATYSDVPMSGLNPGEHYRRFGSVLGRPPRGAPSAKAAVQSKPIPAAPQLAAKDPAPAPPPTEPAKAQATKPKPKRVAASPIIDRPKGFDPSTVTSRPAPPKQGGGPQGEFKLNSLAPGAPSRQGAFSGQQALEGYRRLLNLEAVGPSDAPPSAISCQAKVFQAGAARIDNAWIVDGLRLRLMIAGGEGTSSGAGWAVRAYQARPAAPGDLRMLGEGIQLPELGPVLHAVELLHPLMPVLLELESPDGASTAFALMPFPSLLPGGLHNAELKALQTEPNPMDDFWAFSEALLQEAVGAEGWPQRSLTRIAVATETVAPDETADTPDVREWLSTLFGLAVEASKAESSESLLLLLPPDCVPTISALVSRRLAGAISATTIGPYLVSEAGSFRPRWSIALPADLGSTDAIPVLRGGVGQEESARDAAQIPLAIAIRPQAPPLRAQRNECGSPPISDALSVLVYASTNSGAERIIRSIRAAVPGEIEWLVSADQLDEEWQAALGGACQGQEWRQVAPGASLREIAKDIRNDTLLSISDRIDSGDGDALRVVLDLLKRDETAGSASCALLAEKIVKKEVMLQPASGGLFPTGVSLVRGPRLAFGEPDVLQALPDLDYPVVANTLLFTAWRRTALTGLREMPGTGLSSSEDIRLGLEVMRAGYRNWCTTRATARLSGPYVPRDQIDPVGPGYLHPDRWQDILGRVTIVRELF